jgi:hypothetical protein
LQLVDDDIDLNRIDSCLAISATAAIAEQVGRAHLGRVSFFIPPCLFSAVASFSLRVALLAVVA